LSSARRWASSCFLPRPKLRRLVGCRYLNFSVDAILSVEEGADSWCVPSTKQAILRREAAPFEQRRNLAPFGGLARAYQSHSYVFLACEKRKLMKGPEALRHSVDLCRAQPMILSPKRLLAGVNECSFGSIDRSHASRRARRYRLPLVDRVNSIGRTGQTSLKVSTLNPQ
jgi:hypothetical protein